MSTPLPGMPEDFPWSTSPVADREVLSAVALRQRIIDPLNDAFTALEDDDTDWNVPTLGASWNAVAGAAFAAPQYRRRRGVVWLDGGMASGLTGSANTVFNLPAGFRPQRSCTFLTVSGISGTGEGVARIVVDADGDVYVHSLLFAGTNFRVFFAGVSFFAAPANNG